MAKMRADDRYFAGECPCCSETWTMKNPLFLKAKQKNQQFDDDTRYQNAVKYSMYKSQYPHSAFCEIGYWAHTKTDKNVHAGYDQQVMILY